jgi:hypothetical protein
MTDRRLLAKLLRIPHIVQVEARPLALRELPGTDLKGICKAAVLAYAKEAASDFGCWRLPFLGSQGTRSDAIDTTKPLVAFIVNTALRLSPRSMNTHRGARRIPRAIKRYEGGAKPGCPLSADGLCFRLAPWNTAWTQAANTRRQRCPTRAGR